MNLLITYVIEIPTLGPYSPELLPPGLSPPSEGCRPPYTRSKGFRRAYKLGENMRGDPWCGRPARYVRKTVLRHLTYPYYTAQRQPRILPANAPPDDDAPGPHFISTRHSVFPYNATVTTTIDSTTIDAIPIVDSHYYDQLPMSPTRHNRQMRPPMTTTTCRDCYSDHVKHQLATMNFRSMLVNSCALVTIPTHFLTSQDCTAVSIDTRTALARFIGWSWELGGYA